MTARKRRVTRQRLAEIARDDATRRRVQSLYDDAQVTSRAVSDSETRDIRTTRLARAIFESDRRSRAQIRAVTVTRASCRCTYKSACEHAHSATFDSTTMSSVRDVRVTQRKRATHETRKRACRELDKIEIRSSRNKIDRDAMRKIEIVQTSVRDHARPSQSSRAKIDTHASEYVKIAASREHLCAQCHLVHRVERECE